VCADFCLGTAFFRNCVRIFPHCVVFRIFDALCW
jgi:hypothetical protein